MIRVDETDPVGEVEPSFPYRDVTVRRGVDFKDEYDIQSEIGRGKFGTVYHCKEKTTGLQLAAKVVTTTRKEDRREVEREVEIMRRLQHPRLIQLYDAIDTGKQIYVILELIQGGELFERVIDDDFVLTERSCAVFMRQICEGIEFVHAQHILHLDMKPENILCLTKEGNRIKIIDFGLARHYDPRKKLQVLFGTPEFVAPEVVNFDQIGFGTDMWSIGVICYVLLSGLSPFMGDTDVETMANVTIAKYDFDHDAFAGISDDAKDFIRCLLVKDKEKRATATQCRSHRWLALSPPPMKKIVEVEEVAPMKIVEEVAPTIDPKPEKGKKKKKKQPQPQPQQKPEVKPAKPAAAAAAVVAAAAATPSGSHAKDELDISKDNLRLFVERWREHPDSPYAVTQDSGEPLSRWDDDDREGINRRLDNNLELTSLRGQSPSPCGSVCSSPSEVSGSPAEKSNYLLAAPGNNVVLGLERRASEGNYANIGHRRDQAAQIVLAEEIIKLSEHLRNLAMAQPVGQSLETTPASTNRLTSSALHVTNGARRKSIDEDDETRGGAKEATSRTTIFNQQSTKTKSSSSTRERGTNGNNNNECNEISEKLSSITRQRKMNGTTFNGSRSYERQENNVTSFSLKKTSSSSSSSRTQETSADSSPPRVVRGDSTTESVGNHNVNDDTSTAKPSRVTWRMDAENDVDVTNNREMDLTPPWRRARAMHRFGETCRDVPRISTLRDIHKSLNLDEPKSAKDLLLHLLGEWDDPATRPGGGVGRKSVSVDWCGEESVARRSMNSLAEYFQSEQQKSTTTGVTTNASSTSVHR